MDPHEWFEAGQRLLYPEARKAYYDKGLDQIPAFHLWAWLGIGLSLYERGDRAGAKAAIDRALKLNPEHPYTLCYSARFLSSCSEFKEAVKIYESVLARDPYFLMALTDLGLYYAIKKDLPRAMDFLDKALAINPNFLPAYLTRAKIQFLYQERESASLSLQKALEIDPQAPGPLYDLVRHLLAKNDYSRAMVVCQQFLDCQPASLAVQTNLGIIHRAQGKLPEAIFQFAKCVEADVDYLLAFDALLSTYWGKDRFSLVQEQIRDAEQRSPKNPDTWVVMGSLTSLFGDLERATTYFWKAVEINPRFPYAHYCLGLTHRARHNLPESVAASKHVLDLNPALDVLANRPGPMQWQNNVAGAMAEISKQKVVANLNDPIAWNNYGCAVLAERPSQANHATYQASVRKAAGAFERAIGLNPAFVAAWCNLGDVLPGEASIKAYKEALAIAPDDIVAWYHLAGRLTKPEEQIPALAHIVKIEPRIIVVWNRLGIELERTSRLPEALYCWEQSAKLGDADGRKWVADVSSQGINSKIPDFL